jgi:PKHD-type hydroxylase
MNGEWCYFKSYFSPAMCDRIIKDAMQLPVQDAVVGVDGIFTAVDTRIRKSKVRFIPNTPYFSYLFDEMWKTAVQGNSDFFNFHITRLPFIQFAEYDSSYEGEYKEHHDVFWLNNDPYYHRKLTAVVQLSDPNTYQGGDFAITEATHALDPDVREQGSIIYMPSFLRHKAEKVTKGVRYSLAAWFEGPKWR